MSEILKAERPKCSAQVWRSSVQKHSPCRNRGTYTGSVDGKAYCGVHLPSKAAQRYVQLSARHAVSPTYARVVASRAECEALRAEVARLTAQLAQAERERDAARGLVASFADGGEMEESALLRDAALGRTVRAMRAEIEWLNGNGTGGERTHNLTRCLRAAIDATAAQEET